MGILGKKIQTVAITYKDFTGVLKLHSIYFCENFLMGWLKICT